MGLVQDTRSLVPESSTVGQVVAKCDHVEQWGAAKRILFRFVAAYFFLYILPFPLNAIPWPTLYTAVVGPYMMLWNALVPWVGKHVFHVAITVLSNGSGDTTFNYVQTFCFAAIAAVVAGVWTLLDGKRSRYSRLHYWLRVDVRFYLATTMISYGAVKVIKSQFPYPTLDRLIQPFGDASPMGILWTFMGTSDLYNVFTGAGEILGGLLLTTRRTALLGALVSFAVLSHVFMLNFSYDVPVKLFSLHLMAMAIFLIAPDLGRLARMFVLNSGVEPVEIHPLLGRQWVDRGVGVLRTLLVIAYLGMALQGAAASRKAFGDLAPRSPLYGIWSVDEFEVNGKVRPPLVTDAERWRRVIFDHPQMIAIQLMSDTRRRYMLKLDASSKTMALTKRDDPAWKTSLSYQEPEPGVLALEGTFDGQKIRARLRRAANPEFLLINRGFHWINEYPFNR